MRFDDFQIDFAGDILGHGKDEVGRFNITGKMNFIKNNFAFYKQYIGQHTVVYKGKLQQGIMAGNWEIPGNCKGDFQIRCDAPRWSGCFWQGGNRSDMHLEINVGSGVFGTGHDEVGSFIVRGDANGSNIQFAKQYFGAHTVLYNGYREGNNITGVWQIPNNCDGKFQLHMV